MLQQQDHGRSRRQQRWFIVNVVLTLSNFHTDLAFFEKSLARNSREQQDAQAVEQTTQLGLLLVDKTRFREKFEASLRSCQEVTCIWIHTFPHRFVF